MIIAARKIELHYFFRDDSHSIDAFIRNKNEREILAIINQICDILELDVEVESEAYREGGLKEWFSLKVRKHPTIAAIIIGVLINVISNYISTDSELVELQKQELRLSIEKLKQELNSTDVPDTLDPNIDEISKLFNEDIKIRKHRSNFYEELNLYHKITKIEVVPLSKENKKLDNPKTIVRKNFENYILTSDELNPDIDENAIIEIISPVLKRGKYKWKGLYKGEIIDFYMKDKLFKNSILTEKESFVNGTYIECVMEIARKVNNFGEIINSRFSVLTVVRKQDGLATVLTKQGKQYRDFQEFKKQQIEFNFSE